MLVPTLVMTLLYQTDGPVQRGRLTDLLVPGLRVTTVLLWFIWSVSVICFTDFVSFMSQFILLHLHLHLVAFCFFCFPLRLTIICSIFERLLSVSLLRNVSLAGSLTVKCKSLQRWSDILKGVDLKCRTWKYKTKFLHKLSDIGMRYVCGFHAFSM